MQARKLQDVYDTAAKYMMPEVALAPCDLALPLGIRRGLAKSAWWQSDDFFTRVFGELTKVQTYLRQGDLVEVAV